MSSKAESSRDIDSEPFKEEVTSSVAMKLIGFVADHQALEKEAIRSMLEELQNLFDFSPSGVAAAIEVRVFSPTEASSAKQAMANAAKGILLGTSIPIPYGMISIRLAANLPMDQNILSAFAVKLGWLKCVLVKERIHMDGKSRTDAIVRVALMIRRPDMTREGFERLWALDHARLVLESGPLFHRYATNIVIGDEPWDGILEQWFDSEVERAEHDRLVAEEKPLVRTDVGRFLGKIQVFIGRPTEAI